MTAGLQSAGQHGESPVASSSAGLRANARAIDPVDSPPWEYVQTVPENSGMAAIVRGQWVETAEAVRSTGQRYGESRHRWESEVVPMGGDNAGLGDPQSIPSRGSLRCERGRRVGSTLWK